MSVIYVTILSQLSAQLTPDRPGATSVRLQKSLGFTDGSWLKVKSQGCTLTAEGKRQKVLYPATVSRSSLLDRTFSFRMPSRDEPEMGDSRFCTL
ncbi:hypothetical protein [Microcoleus sp. BROC3]|uniref:hypothetical protein n=1 Tax=Microcoleus sp. BROC3 TaxID=3055323 RepID=UPI002FD03AE1